MKYTPVAHLAFFCSISVVAASPVERVVHLLEDLKAKIEMDDKQETQVYNKYACWCEKTSERKADDINKAAVQIRLLAQNILKLKGKIATHESEIAKYEAEIAQIEKAMKAATAIREKQNARWQSESELIKSCLVTLQEAVTVLVNGTSGTAFLQNTAKVSMAVKSVLDIIPSNLALRPGQLEQLTSFVQAGGQAQYMPQSYTVQGILTDMYETFAADLESATVDEAEQNKLFENLMNLKATEKKTAEKKKADEEAAMASAQESLASDQQNYDDTTAQRDADIAFFDATKKACESKHDDWETRSALRAEEIRGVTQALSILTTDANRALFAKTIKAGKETYADASYNTGVDISIKNPFNFLQVSADSAPILAQQAYAVLKQKATNSHSFRLAALAARVRLTKKGHFEAVITAIDNLLKDLTQEGNDDLAKRDQCVNEYQSIESKVTQLTWLIKNNDVKINELAQLIKKLKKEKADTLLKKAKAVQDKIDLKNARVAENQAFNESKVDDQNAIEELVNAREVLLSYFQNHSIEFTIQGNVKDLALAQQEPDFDISANQAPEAEFSGKGSRKRESQGIVQILTMIIEDLNEEIMNDMRTEEQAQLEYERLDKKLADLIAKLHQHSIDLQTSIVARQADKLAEETTKADNERDLKSEQDHKADIKTDCDYIIKVFTKRAEARTQESEGLQAARAFLVGATTPAPAMLQTQAHAKNTFDDEALPSARFLGLGR